LTGAGVAGDRRWVGAGAAPVLAPVVTPHETAWFEFYHEKNKQCCILSDDPSQSWIKMVATNFSLFFLLADSCTTILVVLCCCGGQQARAPVDDDDDDDDDDDEEEEDDVLVFLHEQEEVFVDKETAGPRGG
jgi:hypothetical protein